VLALATRHLAQPFEAAFEDVFGGTPPDDLNHDVHLTVVAGEPEAHLDRIVRYLRPFGVPVTVVFLSSFEDDGRRYLTRSWLGDDDDPTEPGRTGRRAPWNGRDWYVSFGGDRPWEDARTHQFVSADDAEWVAPVTWLDALPEDEAFWRKGMFTSQRGVSKLRQEFTLRLLEAHFNYGD
jgi:hypothetical protein